LCTRGKHRPLQYTLLQYDEYIIPYMQNMFSPFQTFCCILFAWIEFNVWKSQYSSSQGITLLIPMHVSHSISKRHVIYSLTLTVSDTNIVWQNLCKNMISPFHTFCCVLFVWVQLNVRKSQFSRGQGITLLTIMEVPCMSFILFLYGMLSTVWH
jgi:hypothetical protein